MKTYRCRKPYHTYIEVTVRASDEASVEDVDRLAEEEIQYDPSGQNQILANLVSDGCMEIEGIT